MEVIALKNLDDTTTCKVYLSQPLASIVKVSSINREIIVATTVGNIQSSQIALSSGQRSFLNIPLSAKVNIVPYTLPICNATTLIVVVRPSKMDYEKLEDPNVVLNILVKNKVPYNVGETILIVHKSCYYTVTLESADCNPFNVTEETQLFGVGCIGLSTGTNKPILNLDSINFKELGVGGLETQFEEIFRKVFLPRAISKTLLKRLGIKPAQGILLYGPPGTGKTRLARQIAHMANCKYRIVNGPELLDKFVGEGERKVRELFDPAIKNPDEPYVIIMDEIDSLCKERGNERNGSTNDTIVNQLLTKLDGVDAIPNAIVIGLTNRKDLIDPALLRPGRLEVHIEIGLPDKEGRLQILQIHSLQLQTSKLLAPDVNLEVLAELTENYTGAELESLVKGAVTTSLRQHTNFKDLKKIPQLKEVIVTKEHFNLALHDIVPMFGDNRVEIDRILLRNSLQLDYQETIMNVVIKLIGNHLDDEYQKTRSILLTGISKSGKTCISAKIAKRVSSLIPFVRYIPADIFLCKHETEKNKKIADIFNEAYKSKTAMIIFDDVDIMLDCSHDYCRYSSTTLQTFVMLLTKFIPNDKLIILFTTSDKKATEMVGLNKRIDHQVHIGDYIRA